MTRIVVASRIYSPEPGAAAFRLAAAVRSLQALGHEVEVLTTRSSAQRRSTAGVSRWPVLRDRSGAVRGYVQYASFDVPLFFRLLFRERPGAVLVEPPPTTGLVVALVCRIRKIPFVYYAADMTSAAAAGIGVRPFIVKLLRLLESAVFKRAHSILSVSPGVSDEIRKLPIRDVSIEEVGTGIDTELFRFEPDAARASAPNFVYAGTMSEIQGARIFVEAFLIASERHPEAVLHMYGGGTEVKALQAKTAALSDKVVFHGSVPGERVAEALNSATAALASIKPGAGYDFAFTTKALVALSCGAPVIYAGPGPVRNLVEQHDLGWAVDWEVASIAGAMDEAIRAGRTGADAKRYSEFIRTDYSLASVGRRAAEVVLAAAQPSQESTPE